MARSRDQDRFDDQRQKILATAASVFSEKGFHRATMDDIAERLGTTKGSIYYYFKSKDVILYEICDAAQDDALKYLHEIRSDDSLTEAARLNALIARHLQGMEDNVDAWTVFFLELGSRNDPKAQAIRKKQRQFSTGLEQMLTDAMESNDFRSVLPARLVVLAILGMCNWSYRWIKHEPWAADKIAGVLSDLLYQGLVPTKPSGR